jgi:hypothetical protein
MPAPLPHHGRAGFQRSAGIEGVSTFLELSRQAPQPALQSAARAAMGALLQLIGEPPDDQIATEAQGRSRVMQCLPRTPQLRCRPIDQSGDFTVKLGQVWSPLLPAAVSIEIGRRLARVLASRSIVD